MGFVRKGEFVRSFIHALSSTHYVGAPSRREPNGRSAPADGVFRVVEGADPYKSQFIKLKIIHNSALRTLNSALPSPHLTPLANECIIIVIKKKGR